MNSKHASKRTTKPLEFEVPGTPDQVWQAIATGPGISSWLFPARVEEREGGAVHFDVGPGMESSGSVTSWERPRRFAYEETNWIEGAPPLATEFTIEARAGGTCVVRLVHSLFAASDQWDDEIGGFETGWRGFFRVLRIYLAQFPGQHAAAFRVMGKGSGSEAEAWKSLCAALGLDRVAAGQRWSTAGTGAPPLSGKVHWRGESEKLNELLVITEEPAPGIAFFAASDWGGQVHVPLSFYFFGTGARAVSERQEALWTAWQAEHFAAR